MSVTDNIVVSIIDETKPFVSSQNDVVVLKRKMDWLMIKLPNANYATTFLCCDSTVEQLVENITHNGIVIGSNFTTTIDTGYLVSYNHEIPVVCSTIEQKKLTSIQTIHGTLLYEKGKQILTLSEMKNGKDLSIDFMTNTVHVGNESYNFSNAKQLVNTQYFMIKKLTVYVIKNNGEHCLIYNTCMCYFELVVMLEQSDCRDAIVISESPCNILWKHCLVTGNSDQDFFHETIEYGKMDLKNHNAIVIAQK